MLFNDQLDGFIWEEILAGRLYFLKLGVSMPLIGHEEPPLTSSCRRKSPFSDCEYCLQAVLHKDSIEFSQGFGRFLRSKNTRDPIIGVISDSITPLIPRR